MTEKTKDPYWSEHCRKVRRLLPVLKQLFVEMKQVGYPKPQEMPWSVRQGIYHLDKAEAAFSEYFRDYIKTKPSKAELLKHLWIPEHKCEVTE